MENEKENEFKLNDNERLIKALQSSKHTTTTRSIPFLSYLSIPIKTVLKHRPSPLLATHRHSCPIRVNSETTPFADTDRKIVCTAGRVFCVCNFSACSLQLYQHRRNHCQQCHRLRRGGRVRRLHRHHAAVRARVALAFVAHAATRAGAAQRAHVGAHVAELLAVEAADAEKRRVAPHTALASLQTNVSESLCVFAPPCCIPIAPG